MEAYGTNCMLWIHDGVLPSVFSSTAAWDFLAHLETKASPLLSVAASYRHLTHSDRRRASRATIASSHLLHYLQQPLSSCWVVLEQVCKDAGLKGTLDPTQLNPQDI